MLSEAHYRTVLNFFYFLLLDEAMALNASYVAIRRITKALEKENAPKLEIILIRSLCAVLKQNQNRRKTARSTPPKSDWKLPRLDAALAWKEYVRKADPEASVVLVLRYILGYPPELISQALELPEGTVLFRLGRGLEGLAK